MWQLENMRVDEITPAEYLAMINNGWRRFGQIAFRPRCPHCSACQPIRVPVDKFKANRTQRRTIKKNSELLTLQIRKPLLDTEHVDLYVRHHEYHSELRNWPLHDVDDACASILSFILSPLPVQEWAFFLGEELVAVTYVDEVPDGFSGIYFYWAPEKHALSLGRWICLTLILEAQKRGLKHVYFGYYVKGCISMEYKADYRPNQVLVGTNKWENFLD